MNNEKKIIIIAGPNGAGKTTFAKEFLPKEAGCLLFVNADLIAAGLSPFDPGIMEIRAGRLMLEEIRSHVRKGESFAFETTLSGRRFARMIPKWQEIGYRVKLVFLRLSSADIAVKRVKVRVRQGGHNIPKEVIRRRYEAGWENFQKIYKNLVDAWIIFDNSGEKPIFIEAGGKE